MSSEYTFRKWHILLNKSKTMSTYNKGNTSASQATIELLNALAEKSKQISNFVARVATCIWLSMNIMQCKAHKKTILPTQFFHDFNPSLTVPRKHSPHNEILSLPLLPPPWVTRVTNAAFGSVAIIAPSTSNFLRVRVVAGSLR